MIDGHMMWSHEDIIRGRMFETPEDAAKELVELCLNNDLEGWIIHSSTHGPNGGPLPPGGACLLRAFSGRVTIVLLGVDHEVMQAAITKATDDRLGPGTATVVPMTAGLSAANIHDLDDTVKH